VAATDAEADAQRHCATAGEAAGGAPRCADGERGVNAGALLVAALALPGVAPMSAQAQSAPDQGVVALRYFDYRDWQPGASRMTVRSPSLYALAPLSDSLSLEGSLVYDAMSGASPLYYNALSGASGLGITDYRTAGDVKLTKYYDRFAIGVGGVLSSERDFLSRALSLDVRTWTPDKNRTYAFGIAATHDSIDSTTGVAQGRRRETYDFLLGVTQALSANAIVQSNLTYSSGRGYYDDPYKIFDRRPDTRRVLAWLTRYNQMLPVADATLRLTYRFIHDSWKADSHVLAVEWVQPLPQGFILTPGLRYLTQSRAFFYHDPPIGSGFRAGEPYSADPRLSAFGALTPGMRLEKQFAGGWSADLAVSYYRQRTAWRLGGEGSPGLLDFSARWIELGVQKTF
jgi:hypothetical protein